jgi:hypothetical protein
MHPDLEFVADGLLAAQARMHRLADAVDQLDWRKRPGPDQWSMDECVAHLTLTTRFYLPILADAVDAAPQAPEGLRMRRDPTGWLVSRMLEPPVLMKVPTTAPYLPAGDGSQSATVAAFDLSQAALLAEISQLDGLDPTRLRMTSPFNRAVRYSIYSALHILAAHQRRHLWQAEQVNRRIASQP